MAEAGDAVTILASLHCLIPTGWLYLLKNLRDVRISLRK